MLLQLNGVQRIDEVPIIDGVATTVKAAEMLVGLQQCSNMRITRQGYFYARPGEERVEELRRFYGLK